jgi:hypothetical protein
MGHMIYLNFAPDAVVSDPVLQLETAEERLEELLLQLRNLITAEELGISVTRFLDSAHR